MKITDEILKKYNIIVKDGIFGCSNEILEKLKIESKKQIRKEKLKKLTNG
jgi:hypothetical protein